MPHESTFWLFVTFMAFALMIIVFVPMYTRRRAREEAQQFANQHGFRELHPKEMFDSKERQELEILKRGYGGKARNAWEGMYKGESFRIFDYRYKFGLPLVENVGLSQTVFSMEWHGPELPIFAVAPKIELFWTLRNIKWRRVKPVAGTFFRRNAVITPVPEQMKALLDNGFASFLRSLPQRPHVTIEAGGGRLVLFRKQKIILGKDWPSQLDQLLDMAKVLRGATTASSQAAVR